MKYKCITMLDELRAYLGSAEIVAFDFETSPTEQHRQEERAALDAHKARITGVSFSVSEGTAIYLPIKHCAGANVKERDELFEYLKSAVFENPLVTKVAHNLAFEAMFLYALGIVVSQPCYDTIAAAQMTLKSKWEYRSLSDSGLKPLAASLFGAEMPSFESVTNGRRFDELDPQDWETIRYACADTDYTLRLYHRLNGWFDLYLPQHRLIVESIESPTAVYVGLMKYNGLLVDKDMMLSKQAEAEAKLAQLKNDIASIIGDVDIGANAGTSAFKNYLFKDLGLPVLKSTAKQKDAADDETMILLSGWCKENKPELAPLFELVQEYRKWGKLKSTYIDGYLEHINSATGRIHPDMFPLGTQTGRFASRNPNCQNIPRPDSDAIGVRNFFIAPDGKVILSLDLSQIELRVGAFFCRDEKMLETYRSGGDIHARTTSVIYRIPFAQARDKSDGHYKERRVIAKNCNFGVFYGLFPRGLQRTLKFKAGLNTSLLECGEIIGNLKAGYPGLSRWQDKVKARAANTCFAETRLGRRRYLIGMLSEDWGKRSFAERCALNTPIQGTAADILKLAIGRIAAGLSQRLWLRPLLQVHDELVFELPADKADEAAGFIKACMEAQPFPEFDVPIAAEAAVGARFGSLKEMEV